VLDEFWKAAAGKLADRWAALAGPALAFWAAAVLAWAYAGSGWSRLAKITDWFNKQQTMAQITALIGALIIVVASTIIVQRLTTPVLRLLEGYWPVLLNRLTAKCRDYALKRKNEDTQRYQMLQAELGASQPTAEQLTELARLRRRRHHRPIGDNELLPTRVGNTLRAAETRPRHRYGLDVMLIWPRLWLVLPDSAREELAAARSSLDASVAAAIWGTAFVAFMPLTTWALVGLTVPVAAVLLWVPACAEVFADLLESAVELYRFSLYQQLRWPLPKNPAAERERGEALTKYLESGSDKPYPNFTPA
jgi:hypothetical protein